MEIRQKIPIPYEILVTPWPEIFIICGKFSFHSQRVTLIFGVGRMPEAAIKHGQWLDLVFMQRWLEAPGTVRSD